MRYPHLPQVGTSTLPELPYKRSPNQSSRHGARPRLVWVHVWGGGTFPGVVAWLRSSSSSASAHVVYAGELGPHAGDAAQLVPFAAKAWTESAFNSTGVSVESADAIWKGHDPHGFARLARIVAGLCHFELDACRLVDRHGILTGVHGFTRHADGGAEAGGHTSCPTRDLELWHQFGERVVAEHRHGGFRPSWGR